MFSHMAILLAAVLLAPASVVALTTTAPTPTCTAAPSSTELECNVSGIRTTKDVDYKSVGEPIYVSSVEQCAYYCARRPVVEGQAYYYNLGYCASFEYYPHLSSCQLFNQNVSQVANTTTSQPATRFYYDLGCYDCGIPSCSSQNRQPFGVQLLDNGDFQNKYSLGLWQAHHAFVLSSGKNKYAQMEYVGDNGFPYPTLIQSFAACIGDLYEISFDFTYTNSNDTGHVYYPLVATWTVDSDYFGGWATGIGQTSPQQKATKRHARYFIIALGSDYLYDPPSSIFNFLDRTNSSRFTFDNVVAVRRPYKKPTLVPGSVSPITNGDFESGTVSPFTLKNTLGSKSYDLSITSPGLSGSNYAAQFAYKTNFQYNLQSGVFATKPNRYYLMSAEFASGSPQSQEELTAYITYKLISDGDLSLYSTYQAVPLQNTTKISWPLWVYGETGQALIQIVVDQGAKAKSRLIVIDNIRVDEMEDFD